jgi:DnaJ domain
MEFPGQKSKSAICEMKSQVRANRLRRTAQTCTGRPPTSYRTIEEKVSHPDNEIAILQTHVLYKGAIPESERWGVLTLTTQRILFSATQGVTRLSRPLESVEGVWWRENGPLETLRVEYYGGLVDEFIEPASGAYWAATILRAKTTREARVQGLRPRQEDIILQQRMHLRFQGLQPETWGTLTLTTTRIQFVRDRAGPLFNSPLGSLENAWPEIVSQGPGRELRLGVFGYGLVVFDSDSLSAELWVKAILQAKENFLTAVLPPPVSPRHPPPKSSHSVPPPGNAAKPPPHQERAEPPRPPSKADLRRRYLDFMGLPEEATSEEIRTRYLDLAKIYHGDHWRDKPKASNDMMKKLNEARDFLGG